MSDAPTLAGLHEVEDIQAAGDFEKKHVPYIEVDKSDGKSIVTVKVGYWVAHPNVADHFIQWIEIQANGLTVARYDMNPVVADPEITCVVNVDPGTTITAIESCNLHGTWVNQVTV